MFARLNHVKRICHYYVDKKCSKYFAKFSSSLEPGGYSAARNYGTLYKHKFVRHTVIPATNYGQRYISILNMPHQNQKRLKGTFASENMEHENPLIVKSSFDDIVIPTETNYIDLVWNSDSHNMKSGDAIALVDGMTEETFTYDQCRQDFHNFGEFLINDLNYKVGDVMGILLPNCPAYVIAFSGAVTVGLTVTAFNPSYTSNEIRRQLKMTKVSIILTLKALLPVVKEALCKEDNVKIILVDAEGTNCISYFDMLKKSSFSSHQMLNKKQEFCLQNEVVMLSFSSGTTGLPKGVQTTHQNLIANMLQLMHQKLEFIRPASGDYQPKSILILPAFHIFGLCGTLFPTLYAGGRVISLPKFQPDDFVTALEKYKPTYMHLTPPLVNFCTNYPMVKRHHLDSLESIGAASAPVGKTLIDKFKEKAPNVNVIEGWGMSELTAVTVTPKSDIVHGSCGVLVANTEAKVIDVVSGKLLGANQNGELCIRGPQVMKGYLDDIESTNATISSDGWFHTGDIAYYDNTNHFYIVDRLKELIKVKGFQVAPAELENVIRNNPDVLDVAVIPIPDEECGQIPRAYIVKKECHLTAEYIHEFVNKQVANYKQLAGGIEFIDIIPKSPSGKILRKDLISLYQSKQD